MTDYDRYGRRGKPQQEIYKPGSGPLRKSGREENEQSGGQYRNAGSYRNTEFTSSDRSAEINKITEKLKKINMNSALSNSDDRTMDNNRRIRKPDFEIYVPKPVAEAHANRQKDRDIRIYEKQGDWKANRQADVDTQRYSEAGQMKNEKRGPERSGKRRERKKKGKNSNTVSDQSGEQQNDSSHSQKYRSRESLSGEDRDQGGHYNRFMRYGSEPRSLPTTQQDSRLRDLRSIDTSAWSQDKNRSKPPLGRRGSLSKPNIKPLHPSFHSLPPRLQKKYMAEAGLQDPASLSYVGNISEDAGWNGDSATFKSKQTIAHREPTHDVNTPNSIKGITPHTEWSKTLPNPIRGRGRGRLMRESNVNSLERTRFARSLTPEKAFNSQFENATDDQSERDLIERCRIRDTEEKENQNFKNRSDQPLKPLMEQEWEKGKKENLNIKVDSKTDTDYSDAENVLDWAAEVERCEKGDTPQLSRANSKETFIEPAPPPPKERKKGRKRSISREGINKNCLHHGSVENISNYNVNNSIEGNWRERHIDSRSRKNSSCDNRSRQSSIDRWENFNNRKPRSRQNSSCDNRSRQSSMERSDRQFGNGRSQAVREEGGRRRGNSREKKNVSRQSEGMNWRAEQEQLTRDKGREIDRTNIPSSKPAGILVLPQPITESSLPSSRTITAHTTTNNSHRKLYDPSNPDKPIMVSNARSIGEEDPQFLMNGFYPELPTLVNATVMEQLAAAKPVWYNPFTENFQASRNPQLIRAIEQADCELQYLLSTFELIKYWDRMQLIRTFLKDALKKLLLIDLRFCEVENVEQYMWKIVYYNVIEVCRKLMVEQHAIKDNYKSAMLSIIEEGAIFYEHLLNELEITNEIKYELFLNTPICVRENLKYNILLLIAAQKIYLYLGDLARYKEEANETCNYGLARQWYMKAHQINPKNGKPYNQLALLALLTKRKIDAVYFYMRCLMSSNPILTARESLISIFDESRKKFEATDKKRKDEKAKKEREKMKEKEGGGGIRREIWIHPGGRKNMHRTTSTCKNDYDSEDEELYAASDIEVNKRFLNSYLHVHGKIYTKIGTESLTETALQMLRQFRALLQHSPLPLNSSRFLQLCALNMFAIEISQPKGDMVNNGGCYRSAIQESALVISLHMFNLILERFVKVLQDHMAGPDFSAGHILPPDCQAMLPGIKVWCDWLMTHVEVWNPPPSCQDYKVGPSGDCWTRIASLVNLLEKIDYKGNQLSTEKLADYELVYLTEDATLSGFTPLMANIHEPIYRHKDNDMELSQVSLRIQKIIFFGTVFLCGLDPPVLKLQKVETGESEYISVVDSESIQDQELMGGNETWSESEDSSKETGQDEDEEMVGLAARRRQLQQQSIHRLSQASRITNALTEMEIRPHELVPDTNCFIECLQHLETILRVLPDPQHPYVLMVPLVVVNELEGLSRGCKPSQSVHRSAVVRETAKAAMALFQKRHPALRTCTTRGTVLASTTFTLEEDSGIEMTNDDKILTTCMNLCRTFNKDEIKEGGKRKLYRDVVLLTEDRNLALKAMGRDMPVRSLPDFVRWAGLG